MNKVFNAFIQENPLLLVIKNQILINEGIEKLWDVGLIKRQIDNHGKKKRRHADKLIVNFKRSTDAIMTDICDGDSDVTSDKQSSR